MDLQLRGKRALVSGSTAGIGLAIAKGLSAEGARVIVNGREQASVDRARAEIAEATTADVDGYAGDLAQASVAAALATAFPDVDILINNLGIFDPKPFEEIPDADWVRFFEVNVLSGVRLSRLYLPRMREKDWGRIIFISSESGDADPVGDDALRHDQNGPDCRGARHRRDRRGYGHHREQRSAGSDPVARRRRLRGGDGGAGREAGRSRSRPSSSKRSGHRRSSSALPRSKKSRHSLRILSSPLASATTGSALRVDGGVVRSAF